MCKIIPNPYAILQSFIKQLLISIFKCPHVVSMQWFFDFLDMPKLFALLIKPFTKMQSTVKYCCCYFPQNGSNCYCGHKQYEYRRQCPFVSFSARFHSNFLTYTYTYPYDIGHIIRHSIEKNKQFAWSLLATFIPILSDNFIFSLRNEYLRSKIKWFYVCNIMYGCYVCRLKDLVHMMVNNWPILLGILVIVILCWTKLK